MENLYLKKLLHYNLKNKIVGVIVGAKLASPMQDSSVIRRGEPLGAQYLVI